MDTEERQLHEAHAATKLTRPESAGSPPPNCAICLGACANKCVTDCCLHQFCFKCLLEWSKIKAECPLCKQPFKSIIYNIKSNTEYEEHVIVNPERELPDDDLALDADDPLHNLFLPNGPRPQRHFQFRTTLTVDPGGELAIQQLLLSHPLTNTLLLPSSRYHRARAAQQTITFRRAVYQNDWWVYAPPDITGRYRDCTPNFFRENPAQTHRITPWLNRELSALISDYVDIFVLQEVIMEMLCQYPIHSTSFRTRIVGYIGAKTDHFLHEFYNFVRSPFDMIGYDRHVRYTQHRPNHLILPTHALSDDDDDSDVRVIDSPNDCIYIAPRTPEVIVIHSDNSDSDVIIREPTPPVVVDLIDTDSDDQTCLHNNSSERLPENEVTDPVNMSPKLPVKLRLKLRKPSLPCRRRKDKNSKRRFGSSSESDSTRPKSDSDCCRSDMSDSSSSDEDSHASGSDWTPVKSEFRYTQPLVLKRKTVKKEFTCKNSNKTSSKKKYSIKKFVLKTKSRSRKNSSDAKEDSIEKNYKTKKSSRKSSKQKKSKRRDSDHQKLKKNRSKRFKVEYVSDSVDSDFSKQDKCVSTITNDSLFSSDGNKSEPALSSSLPDAQDAFSPLPSSEFLSSSEILQSEEISCSRSSEYDVDIAGPSTGVTLRSVVVQGNNMWYSRPDLVDTSTDNNSD